MALKTKIFQFTGLNFALIWFLGWSLSYGLSHTMFLWPPVQESVDKLKSAFLHKFDSPYSFRDICLYEFLIYVNSSNKGVGFSPQNKNLPVLQSNLQTPFY